MAGTGGSEWSTVRYGDVDPLIPTSVAWPSGCRQFQSLMKKWAPGMSAEDTKSELDIVLAHWSRAAKTVSECVHHPRAASTAVARRTEGEQTVLSCNGRELSIDTVALTMLRVRRPLPPRPPLRPGTVGTGAEICCHLRVRSGLSGMRPF